MKSAGTWGGLRVPVVPGGVWWDLVRRWGIGRPVVPCEAWGYLAIPGDACRGLVGPGGVW